MIKRKNSITFQFSEKFHHFVNYCINYKNYNCGNILNNEKQEVYEEDFSGSFIDIGNREDLISFLSYDKITKMYNDFCDTCVENGDKPAVFTAWYRSRLKSDIFYTDSNRTQLKIGRFLRKMLPGFSDSKIEEFANMYKAYHNAFNYDIEVVTGDDIIKYYDQDHQELENYGASLAGSCMAYNGDDLPKKGITVKDELAFYAKNPNCSLLVLKKKNSDKIKGRALLWTLKNGRKYLDTPYVDFECDYMIYDNYAKDNLCLTYKDIDYESINNGGTAKQLEVASNDEIKRIFGSNTGISLPYLDTFAYDGSRNLIYV